MRFGRDQVHLFFEIQRHTRSGRLLQMQPLRTGVDGDRTLDRPATTIPLEGVILKGVDSTYRPGRRAPAWIPRPVVAD